MTSLDMHWSDPPPVTAQPLLELERVSRVYGEEVLVYALRLDRGLSPPDVLQTVPGTRWSDERGLTDHHYIVPGGGGLGEIINNSFV